MTDAGGHHQWGFVAGYSGHALVIAEAATLTGYTLKGYFDTAAAADNPLALTYLGNEADTLREFKPADGQVVLGIGDNRTRGKVSRFFRDAGFQAATIVHPGSIVSSMASIGAGSFVGANACVNAMAKIDQDCIINTGAIVEHGCRVGYGSHLAPGAVLSGDVSVGKQCFIGAGAVVKQGVRIGANAVVGAGAVVVKNMPAGEQWVGVPARLQI